MQRACAGVSVGAGRMLNAFFVRAAVDAFHHCALFPAREGEGGWASWRSFFKGRRKC